MNLGRLSNFHKLELCFSPTTKRRGVNKMVQQDTSST